MVYGKESFVISECTCVPPRDMPPPEAIKPTRCITSKHEGRKISKTGAYK